MSEYRNGGHGLNAKVEREKNACSLAVSLLRFLQTKLIEINLKGLLLTCWMLWLQFLSINTC